MNRQLFYAFILVFVTVFASVQSSKSGASAAPETRELPASEYHDKMRGGFLGQTVGVTYALPFEFTHNGVMVPEEDLPDYNPWRPYMWGPVLVIQLLGAVAQDDIYVELTFLETIERHGLDASIEQFGRDFGDSKYMLWHANKAGRDNIRAGIMPPLSGHPRHNEHADDIDFQIEADVFGMICPGMSRATQDITWKVGHVMNYGDGVYGGVFVAGMYSAAFFESDRMKVLEAGLELIPDDSNYELTIRDVMVAYEDNPHDWRHAWQIIEDKWGGADKNHCPDLPQNFIGANINGAYVVIGLLYGEGDPMETIRIATMCGRDADCNAASALGVLGTIIGYEDLPDEFKKGLPFLEKMTFLYTSYTYEGAIEAIEQQAEAMVIKQGGSINSKTWTIPIQEPRELPLEKWSYGTPGSEVPLPEGKY